MNIIGGLPRSGSTLLQNILNQNPRFRVSSTSPLPGFLELVSQTWTGSAELKGEQALNKEEAEAKRMRVFRGICEAWYPEDKIIFDKSRGWNHNLLMLRHLYPDAKAVICIRDLREIFASVEKQHRKDPTVNLMPGMNVIGRAQNLFSPKGMIGSCLLGIQDILARKLDVEFIKAEELTANPKFVVNKLYCYLGEEEQFEHDFEDVENTSQDPDFLYWDKYPHVGSGKVVKLETQWQHFMSDELAKSIMDAFPWYNQKFGYR